MTPVVAGAFTVGAYLFAGASMAFYSSGLPVVDRLPIAAGFLVQTVLWPVMAVWFLLSEARLLVRWVARRTKRKAGQP